MEEKDKIISEFIPEMLKAAPDDYMEIKLILMAHSAGKPALVYFLQEVSQNLIKSVVSSCENALNVRLQ